MERWTPTSGYVSAPSRIFSPREEEWALPRDGVCPRLDVAWDPHRDEVLPHDAECRPRDAMVARLAHGAVDRRRIDVDPLVVPLADPRPVVMDPHLVPGDVDHPHDDLARRTIIPRAVGDLAVTQAVPHRANKKKLTMMDGKLRSTSVVKHPLRFILIPLCALDWNGSNCKFIQ